MNSFPKHCYYVRHVPIARMTYKTEHLVWEDTDWCLRLEDDIRENGLIAPLILDNTGHDLSNRPTPLYKVYVGHHRAQACERIGWTHMPCVIYGSPIPSEWEQTHIKGMSPLKAYFPAHENLHLYHGRIMNGNTMAPETMKYPPNNNPYWPEGSEQK